MLLREDTQWGFCSKVELVSRNSTGVQQANSNRILASEKDSYCEGKIERRQKERREKTGRNSGRARDRVKERSRERETETGDRDRDRDRDRSRDRDREPTRPCLRAWRLGTEPEQSPRDAALCCQRLQTQCHLPHEEESCTELPWAAQTGSVPEGGDDSGWVPKLGASRADFTVLDNTTVNPTPTSVLFHRIICRQAHLLAENLEPHKTQSQSAGRSACC